MKKNILQLLLALSFSTSAFATAYQDCQPPCKEEPKYYASAFAGANWLQPRDDKYVKFKTGYAGAVALGLFINPDWRLEAEASYRRNELDYIKVFSGHHIRPSFHSDTLAALANLYYEMNAGGKYRPYIGLGLGYCQVRVVYTSHYGNLKAEKGQIASQVILGVKTDLTDSVDLGVEYRYFTSKHDLIQQSVGLSLTQKFGLPHKLAPSGAKLFMMPSL